MLCLSHPPHPLACGLLSYLHPSQIHTLSRSLSTGKCFQQLSFSLLCTSEELVFNHISPPMKADTHHVLLCCSRQHVTNRSPVEIQGVDYICMVQRRASQLTHSINRADEKWGLREGRRKSQSVYHAYKKVAVSHPFFTSYSHFVSRFLESFRLLLLKEPALRPMRYSSQHTNKGERAENDLSVIQFYRSWGLSLPPSTSAVT